MMTDRVQREGNNFDANAAVQDAFREMYTGPSERLQHLIPALIEMGAHTIMQLQSSNIDIPDSYLMSYIDVLDTVLQIVDPPPESAIFQDLLKTLMKLCGRADQLPRSCFVPSKMLTKVGSYATFHGGFANVWHGSYDERDVALKELQIYEQDDLKAICRVFYREVLVWKFLRHPNVLPFVGINESISRFCMISPWATNGNITQYLKQDCMCDRTKLLQDAAAGLSYLHTLGIVHGDLKSANILINFRGEACLADFGLATFIHNVNTIAAFASTTGGIRGSVRWMAPERMDPEGAGYVSSQPTKASDVYSFGITMVEVFTGVIPFHNSRNDAAVIAAVLSGKRPSRPPQPQAEEVGLSSSVWALIERCWDQDPRKRPIIASVIEALQISRVLTFEFSEADQDHACRCKAICSCTARCRCKRDPTYGDPCDAVALLRAWGGNADHFYTTSVAEMYKAVKNIGYKAEPNACYVYATQVGATVPLYRAWSVSACDHFYTTSLKERDNAVAKLGYANEGVAAYVFASQICDAIPLYRLYKPGSSRDHFYTTSFSERNRALNSHGYEDEGIACYVLPIPGF